MVDSRGARRRLAELFAPPRDLMFQGSIERAREKAKSESKWVLVTLHDPSEFPCQTLNRDLWKDSSVKEIVLDSFVFLQVCFQTDFLHLIVLDGIVGRQALSQFLSGRLFAAYCNFRPSDRWYSVCTKWYWFEGERVKIWSSAPSPSEFLLDGIVCSVNPSTL